MTQKHRLDEINSLTGEEFVRIIGPVFEHSPWIAEAIWGERPFASLEELHLALCEMVESAGGEKQLALIRAHPDLVGQAALAGTLTRPSNSEQASSGLDKLAPGEIATFQTFNRTYHEKFGFPFVICARLNEKEAILAGFKKRLRNSRPEEIKTALEQIRQIAYLRLKDIIQT